MKLGVLTGLARELACLPGDDASLVCACSGASPARAEALSTELVDRGCDALLSLGVAGALSPELRVGDIVISEAVVDEADAALVSDIAWKTRVFEGLQHIDRVRCGVVLGAEAEISTAPMKAALYQRTGAICVDMESHRMARVARSQSTPFLAIRVISDDSHRTLPSAALGVIGADGKPVLGRVVANLVKMPQQIPALIRLARDMETALSRLRRVTGLIGPLFLRP